MSNCFPINKSFFIPDVILEESPSPGSMGDPKRILVVMDGLKEFSVDLLEWVLKNFAFRHGCSITLLGITPWLNIPLSSKTWSDIWAMDLEDLSSFLDKHESLKTDPRIQKIQRLIDLCQKYGVVPEIRTEMGHPIRLLVVEQISSLHATLVVFDRHHDKKFIKYYARKIPCSMIAINYDGNVDLIKKRKCRSDNDSPGDWESPATVAPCSKSIISQHLKKYLKPKA